MPDYTIFSVYSGNKEHLIFSWSFRISYGYAGLCRRHCFDESRSTSRNFLAHFHVTVDELDRCLCPLGVQSEFARVGACRIDVVDFAHRERGISGALFAFAFWATLFNVPLVVLYLSSFCQLSKSATVLTETLEPSSSKRRLLLEFCVTGGELKFQRITVSCSTFFFSFLFLSAGGNRR